ncbi:MAG: T9SS type A sorting domain-containing protein [Cytophagales bacterium]|nr:T9SS type A sorting domain-containing protein [Cytophagales bacterium]
MKKLLLTTFGAIGFCIGSFAQPFFEAVTFTGAFPVNGNSYTARIEGGFTETFATGNWADGWANWYPNAEAYSSTYTATLEGDVTSDRSISGVVEMKGTVHVRNGATLTIAAGTVIRAGLGATLIIAKGSKINAVGTKTAPIVFTSSKAAGQRAPGDWAGILIIGNSQVNTPSGKRQYEALPTDPLAEYGGGRGAELNLNDNSGEMRFVRIEFAGYNYLPDQELNGLTLGAVGKGTRINFIQVSYARDDAFEWFGGTSNHKYLIAIGAVDDDFDMDEGYAGNVQFIIAVKNPTVFETAAGGTSNSFEHDNNTGVGSASAVVPGNNNPEPNTAPFVSNATLIGPWINTGSGNPTPTAGNKFGRGMEMRSAVSTSVYNSIVIGHNQGIQLVNASASITPSVQERLSSGVAQYKNLHIVLNGSSNSGTARYYASTNESISFDEATYLSSNGNTVSLTNAASDIFQQVITSFTTANPAVNFTIKTSSPTAGVAADFTGLIAPKTLAPELIALQPFASVDKSSIAFGTKVEGQSFAAVEVKVNVLNLTGTGITMSSSNPKFTLSATTATNTNGEKTFTVTFASATAAAESGTITINYGDSRVANVVIPVTGTVVAPAAPVINVDVATLSFTDASWTGAGPYVSQPQQVAVTGNYLKANVIVTAPAGYEVSATPTGTYSSTLTLTANANETISATVSVRANLSTQSSSNSGNLTFVAGAASTSVALSANTNPAFTTGTAVTIDYFTGQLVSTLTGALNVRGNRLPSSVVVTSLSPDLFVSNSANGPFNSATATLAAAGNTITTTGNNIWVQYTGTIAGNTNGVQVGVLSVTGLSTSIAVSIRLNAPAAGSFVSSRWILSDASSRVITALGFNFNDVMTTGTWIYRNSDNALLGAVSALGTSNATLSGNALFTTNTVYPVTFAGVIDSDVNSMEITGTGTNFNMLWPTGLPIHYNDGTLIGYLNAVISADRLSLQSNALVTSVAGTMRTSAIQYRRQDATISVSPASPLALNIATYINGVPQPVVGTIAITGSHHNSVVNVGINPALSASGYMFELNAGTTPASVAGVFSLVITPSGTGAINQTITVRYVPTNITALSLPALNVNAAHSTELLILADNRALTAGVSSSNPRRNLAYNLRGSAFPSVTVNKASLAKFTAYAGVASGYQKFNVAANRMTTPIVVSAPANFQLSTSADFTGATNSLTIATIAGNSVSPDVFVRYNRADVGQDAGAISVATDGIASIPVNVSGEAVGFSRVINLIAQNNSTSITFSGSAMATVSGQYLTSDLTLSVTGNFGISTASATAIPTASEILTTDPTGFGDVDDKTVYITYKGASTVVGTGSLTASSTGATSVTIDLVGGFVTSLAEVATAEPTIVVYPNPSEGSATLAIENVSNTIKVSVYNVTGTEVYSFEDSVSGVARYPLTGLSQGVYIVRVATEKTVKTVRLVVK